MKIKPGLEEVKRYAAMGDYRVFPVSCELLSDICTPIEAMRILKNVSTHCYLLESVAENEKWGRYTFLGYDPKLEITCMDGEMKIGNLKVKTDDPSSYLRQILSDYKSPRFDYLPSFTGGLVGYFSFDYLNYSEPSTRCEAEDTEDATEQGAEEDLDEVDRHLRILGLQDIECWQGEDSTCYYYT